MNTDVNRAKLAMLDSQNAKDRASEGGLERVVKTTRVRRGSAAGQGRLNGPQAVQALKGGKGGILK